MVGDENNYGADDSNDDAFQIESGDSRNRMDFGEVPVGRKEPSADDGTDNAEEDISGDSLSPVVDDLATDEPRDEPEDDPGNERHKFSFATPTPHDLDIC